MALVLRYVTKTQLGNAFRELYRASRGRETFRLATWLVNRIADGTFTQNEVRNFFGLTPQEATALYTKWQDWKAKYDEMNGAIGE
jgi:hypothetical protein